MYLTFGPNMEYHVQAYLSMLSFYKQMTKEDRIVMVTNMPQYYKYAEKWADVIAIDNQQIKEWEGPHHYRFRIKTMAMKQQVENHPNEHLLFVDTDTFLYGKLNDIRDIMNQNNTIMHKDEGHPSKMKSASLRMWHTVSSKTLAGVTLGMQHNMWNSGIIGIPAQLTQEIINHTISLLDAMLDIGVKSFNVEQYALSVAMIEHSTIKEATSYVAHYWGNKQEWKAITYELIAKAHMKQLSLKEELAQIDISELRTHPIYVHQSSTGKRLKELINNLFKDKGHKYI